MAAQPEAAEDASSYETQQEHLAVVIAPLVARAVAQIDVTDLEVSLSRFFSQIVGIAHEYGRTAAVLAMRWYRQDRAQRGVPGKPAVSLAPKPTTREILSVVDVERIIESPDLPMAQETVARDVAAAVDQIALSQGDRTVQNAVERDREATHWARGLEPGACWFCSMLASRGGAFKTEETASVKVHKNCRCYPIPVYRGEKYRPGFRERRAQKLWKTAVTDKHLTGKDAQKAYRAAIEGRKYIPSKVSKSGSKGDDVAQLDRDLKLTRARRAELIGRLRKSEAACKRAGGGKTLESVRRRISQLEAANIAARKAA